jgi:hypothetical protein
MRGYDLCRSHLDPTLGPRGAGAPYGNLNAIKTGEHINPTGYAALKRLANQIANDPDSFHDLITAHIDDLYNRVGYGQALPRSLRTIIALQHTMKQLIPHLTNVLFIKELDCLAQSSPPEDRAAVKHDIWALLAPYSPRQRLMALVEARRRDEERDRRRQQTAEQPAPSNPTSENRRDAENN